MQEKKITLGIQLSTDLNERLNECAKAEKRTKRAIVELALEEYLESSQAYKRYKEEK